MPTHEKGHAPGATGRGQEKESSSTGDSAWQEYSALQQEGEAVSCPSPFGAYTDEQLEASLLGGLFLEPEKLEELPARIDAEDFALPENKLIFGAIVELHRKGAPIGLRTVHSHLEERGQLERAGGLSYTSEVLTCSVTSAHVEREAEELAKRADGHRSLQAARKLLDDLEAGRDPEAAHAEHLQACGRREAPEARPVDIFGGFAPPPFPVDDMPATIRDFAKDQAKLVGIDAGVICMAALGAVAGCLDDRLRIQPKRFDPTWLESARLWVGIIGDPSTKKSPGLQKALAPVRKIAARWREEHQQELAKWKQEAQRTAEEDLLEGGAELPEEPKLKRLTADDATVEKLADILANAEPRGIIIVKDELRGWLSSMDCYKGGGGKDKAQWLEAYNGGCLEIDRVKRGSTWVENWSASVVGGIQPGVIHEYAKAADHDGMIQRFMMVYASTAPQGVDRAPDLRAKDAYAAMLNHLVEVRAGEKPVQLSEAAHGIRESFNQRLHDAITSFPNAHLTAMLGKWEGLFARVCLVFHAAECADSIFHPSAVPVSEDTAKKVDRLLWRCLLPHAVKFFSGLDTAEDAARQLAGLILAHKWERFTVKRDLDRNMRATRSMAPWEREGMLDRLEAYGWITPEPGKVNERGRPAAYAVNRQVHELYAGEAEKEQRRREKVATMMADLK